MYSLLSFVFQMWNDHLRMSDRRVKSASEGGVDEKVERKKSADIKLFLVSDEGGTLKIEEVKAGPLKKSDLDAKVSPQVLMASYKLSFSKSVCILDLICCDGWKYYVN